MAREMQGEALSSLPILDLSYADDPSRRLILLQELHNALFNVGFLYIKNHGVPLETITNLVSRLPALFNQGNDFKASLSKLNSPHFLGYSGFAEETTLGKKDLREQFDLATELPVVWQDPKNHKATGGVGDRDFTKLYWRLRGPNQWPCEDQIPGFKNAYLKYHDALQALSYRFVHLVEEAFGIPIGTFDNFFLPHSTGAQAKTREYMPPQHRIKLVKYPPSTENYQGQGVGAHKDSSGWLTFLYQVGREEGLEVVSTIGEWILAPPIEGTFVVNFGNAFEAATDGAVKATVHRVKAPLSTSNPRYSIPFFQGLPLDLTISEIRRYIPESVRKLRRESGALENHDSVSTFLDSRWDSLGESQLRKWIRSHEEVGRKWYGDEVASYYLR
ncbi:Clavaminate synthase-like protein [Glonium stellatum]|uniref:Clavaminate synthase-like protein n=1 Tax=Glonium stellatum TaxID=574774 RepID=A0A8E2EV76_9PEZI|nr:Clavaminate synthase-like protein [Glonium stellatum]